MKEKYNANIVSCIEIELYPVISQKISQKVLYDVDRKVDVLSTKFVAVREYEMALKGLQNSID